MSTPIWFIKVPAGISLPDEGPDSIIHEENGEGWIDFRSDIVVLGTFQNGEWDDDNDFPGWDRYWAAPAVLFHAFPPQYFLTVTEELISKIEKLVPVAQDFDTRRDESWRGETRVPSVVASVFLGAMPLQARLEVILSSARQGLSELEAGQRLLIAMGC